jgi:hypothetical protein
MQCTHPTPQVRARDFPRVHSSAKTEMTFISRLSQSVELELFSLNLNAATLGRAQSQATVCRALSRPRFDVGRKRTFSIRARFAFVQELVKNRARFCHVKASSIRSHAWCLSAAADNCLHIYTTTRVQCMVAQDEQWIFNLRARSGGAVWPALDLEGHATMPTTSSWGTTWHLREPINRPIINFSSGIDDWL